VNCGELKISALPGDGIEAMSDRWALLAEVLEYVVSSDDENADVFLSGCDAGER
jgi:hypothetical protein